MNKAPEITAIILCGGESKRMGKPKYSLHYHQLPQYQHLLNLCHKIGLHASVSCNKLQQNSFINIKETIVDNDEFANAGPISGLLSAIALFPENAILLLGCDYPNISTEDLLVLIEDFQNHQQTVCYYQAENEMIEPLLAIYHPNDFEAIKIRFKKQQTALRHFLKESVANRIKPKNIALLKSFDTPEDFNSFIAPPNA